jgi:SAM-dependent methyltransferase
MLPPWEHPDWYDLHDTAWTAGPEREPEHYRELILSLPPLDADDHLADIGTGTGKLARMIVKAYPELGRVTLVEPNAQKVVRAERALAEALPRATTRIRSMAEGLGTGRIQLSPLPTVVTVGSVLMPALEMRGGTLRNGITWLDTAIAELAAMVAPGGHLLLLETIAAPWARSGLDEPTRRLSLSELGERLAHAGLRSIECTYRFRDRVILVIRPDHK